MERGDAGNLGMRVWIENRGGYKACVPVSEENNYTGGTLEK